MQLKLLSLSLCGVEEFCYKYVLPFGDLFTEQEPLERSDIVRLYKAHSTCVILCCLRNCRNLILLPTGTQFLLQSVSEHRGEMGR